MVSVTIVAACFTISLPFPIATEIAHPLNIKISFSESPNAYVFLGLAPNSSISFDMPSYLERPFMTTSQPYSPQGK